ncbi:efflux RND transporter periplasmic adaptor subunit [Motiliproteus sp. MSK22-1]|uniref:efflux RND transporter periplasmic adaptor subunit n=1 Tax=Motiliproteus sp. MSK22-1 TaxID=1897630 RepID=UPI000977169B|nr:efflux RND transporter periplasmic adaptor subunit [Motiliproteus sp. MSK22-1]OMH32778.1 hypothetical protein BGP75_14735 [Motiliproteus sp. MSK22-1]
MRQKVIVRILSLVITGGVLLLTMAWYFEEPSTANRVAPVPRPLPEVEVYQLETQAAIRKLVIHGEVRAKWETTLVSRVEGAVTFISDKLKDGGAVIRGEVLLRIDPELYDQRLTDAQAQVAATELALIQAKSEAKAAERGWQLSGNSKQPSNDLVLKKPVVANANAALKAAQARLESAKLALSRTVISAPYDAIIVKRNVSLGGSVQPGQELLTFFSRHARTLSLLLSETQWRILPDDMSRALVTVSDPYSKQQWQIKEVRQAGYIDRQSRLRTIHLEFEGPDPGQFVTAEIQGTVVKNSLKIPATAYDPSGAVWFVDKQGKLDLWRPELVSSEGDTLVVTAPRAGQHQIIRFAYGGLKEGQQVQSLFTSGLAYVPGNEHD